MGGTSKDSRKCRRDTLRGRFPLPGGLGLEPEDQRQRFVDGLQLCCVEAPGGPPEALRVDDRGLLDQDLRLSVVEQNLWAEGRRTSARRRRGDQGRAERHQLIGLDHDGVTRAALLTSSGAPGGGEPEDLAANHL